MKDEKPALPPFWWRKVSAMCRPYLKTQGATLQNLKSNLDDYKKKGIDALEVFAPCLGGNNYNGLDTLDYYTINPEIGTMADFLELIKEAHKRDMAVIVFINLGYGHESFPAFQKACDDIREGIESGETSFFLWSDSGNDTMDRSDNQRIPPGDMVEILTEPSFGDQFLCEGNRLPGIHNVRLSPTLSTCHAGATRIC